MPKKIHVKSTAAPRPERRAIVDASRQDINTYCHKTFSELCQQLKNLKSLSE